MRVARLTERHTAAIQALLLDDPLVNLFLLGYVEAVGVHRAYWYGVLDGEAVRALVLLVPGRLMVPWAPDPDDARQRDRFLAAFAHELRTPVAVARGWATMLADGEVPDDQLTSTHERLADALTRLSEHILDVELSTSASLGRVRVNLEPLDLVSLCRALPGSPGVRSGADLTVHGDPSLLSRVIRDLWATARRDPAPDHVWIDVVETGSWHEIRVVREGTPISPMVLKALRDYGMDAAMWGYGVEVGTHAVRIMASGTLDHFPKLKIVIGHMGEAVHFWLWRLNFMNSRSQKVGRAKKTELSMAEYFHRNFAITTSGVEDPLALEYSIKKLGVDNVMWAIDYPYQPTEPAVRFMDEAPLSDEDKAKVYAGNAERIFKIAPAGN